MSGVKLLVIFQLISNFFAIVHLPFTDTPIPYQLTGVYSFDYSALHYRPLSNFLIMRVFNTAYFHVNCLDF